MATERILGVGLLAASLTAIMICWTGICPGTAQAAPGVLDTTFGGTGWVASTPPPQPGNESVEKVLF